MRHSFCLLTIVLLSFVCYPFVSSAQSSFSFGKDTPQASVWAKQHFKKGSLPPFSFKLGDVSSDKFISKWRFTKSNLTPESGKFSVEYKDPLSGLAAVCDITVFEDYNAVEWTLSFRNDGKDNSLLISEVKSIDAAILYSGLSGDFVLNHLNGSLAAMDDFAPHYDNVSPDSSLVFSSKGGRSSSGAFPFFNIITPSGCSGVIMSIGWSGDWSAEFDAFSGKSFSSKIQIKSGMTDFDSYLEPGETVRMPKISFMFWNGGNQEPMNMLGNNKFRRFVLAHHSRKIDGKTALYPLCGGLNYGDPAPLNEYTGMTTDYAKFIIDRFYDFEIFPDSFWLDAGWYKNSADWRNKKAWWNTVGSWTEDEKRFPGTLKEVSDHAHEKGGKLMVWFEPERAYKDSDIYREHSEWLISKPGATNQFLLNIGDPDALDWICKSIGDFIQSRGIDIYRQDFNINPQEIWTAADKPGRKGMTEVRYIEGLYKFWDYLLDRFPNLLIDNCASGGRRLDIETFDRSSPLWRTDYSYGEVNGAQNQTYGLEWFLPQQGTAVYRTDKYSARSCYSSAMVMNFKLTDRNESFIEMKKVYDEYIQVRPYFLEDFYPLSGVDDITSLSRWIVYELFRPSDGTGYVFAFRRPDSKESSFIVKLQGLDPEGTYSLIDSDTLVKTTLSGKSLAAGYELKIENPRDCLLLRIEH